VDREKDFAMKPLPWVPLASLITMVFCTSGCAVVMAVNGAKDPDVGVLAIGEDRAVVLATIGPPQKTYITPARRVDVFKWKRGDEPSAGRAIAHGVMDLATLCLWEIVGTPIEFSQGDVFYMSVQYDSEDRVVRMIPGDDGAAIASMQRERVHVSSDAKEPPADTAEASATAVSEIAKSVVKESRTTGRKNFLQTLFSNTGEEFAKSARAIANDAHLGDVEKLHALATLSAVHAASAKDTKEKETYARLNENFLKRAESLEIEALGQTVHERPGRSADEEIAEGRIVSIDEAGR
jgi:hypothetical protein